MQIVDIGDGKLQIKFRDKFTGQELFSFKIDIGSFNSIKKHIINKLNEVKVLNGELIWIKRGLYGSK